MPSPGELIQALHSTLTATLEHIKVIDEYEERAQGAKARLDATVQEFNATLKRLEGAKAELAKTEADLASKKHLINDEAARALQSTQRQIAARQEELKTLEVAVKAKREEHDGLIASMQALGQRLKV